MSKNLNVYDQVIRVMLRCKLRLLLSLTTNLHVGKGRSDMQHEKLLHEEAVICATNNLNLQMQR